MSAAWEMLIPIAVIAAAIIGAVKIGRAILTGTVIAASAVAAYLWWKGGMTMEGGMTAGFDAVAGAAGWITNTLVPAVAPKAATVLESLVSALDAAVRGAFGGHHPARR